MRTIPYLSHMKFSSIDRGRKEFSENIVKLRFGKMLLIGRIMNRNCILNVPDDISSLYNLFSYRSFISIEIRDLLDSYYNSMLTSKRQRIAEAFRNFELLQSLHHELAALYIFVIVVSVISLQSDGVHLFSDVRILIAMV